MLFVQQIQINNNNNKRNKTFTWCESYMNIQYEY